MRCSFRFQIGDFGCVKTGQTHTPIPSEILRGGGAKHTEEDLGEQYISRARQSRAKDGEEMGV